MEGSLPAVSINSCAIVVHSADNVAVVKSSVAPETLVEMSDGSTIRVKTSIGAGNRFATRSIPAGSFVLQYGQPIGTSLGIGEGDLVSHANMSDEVPVRRDLPDDLSNAAPVPVAAAEAASFQGFRRGDGR